MITMENGEFNKQITGFNHPNRGIEPSKNREFHQWTMDLGVAENGGLTTFLSKQ
jgi:hypothetical protein